MHVCSTSDGVAVMEGHSHFRKMGCSGYCISHDVFVTWNIVYVPVDSRQRFDPPCLFTIQALLRLEVPQGVVVRVDVDRLVVF